MFSFECFKKRFEISSTKWFSTFALNDFKKQSAQLELYDGCGNIVESWNYEGIYPVNVDFDNLDMATGDILMVNLTLRYDRAYMVGQNLPDGGDPFIGSGGQNTSRPLPLLGGGQTQF